MNALLLVICLTISGECGALGNGCEEAVARTIANRVGAPGFPATLTSVLEAYYAKADVPTSEAIRVARLLLTDPDALKDDRWYYCYSDADMRTQGWRRGDRTICHDGLCLHLSHDWPGG